MIAIGAELTHPIHGVMTVKDVKLNQSEFIEGEWRHGSIITSEFERPIGCVKWKTDDGRAMLIFHSYYLKNLD